MTKKESNEIAIIEKKEVTPIEAKIKTLSIKGPKEMTIAAECLSQANKFLDQVIAYKETKTKPLNAALKVIRAETKPLETRLEEVIQSIRSKMGAYQTEKTRLADIEAKKIGDRVGEGKGHFKTETAMAKINEIDKPDAEILADSGSVKFRKVKKYRVTDITQMPFAYLAADDTKVKEAMNSGLEIAGVEYYTEEIPINSR